MSNHNAEVKAWMRGEDSGNPLIESLVEALYRDDRVNICWDGCRTESRDKFVLREIIANAYARHHPADEGRGLLESCVRYFESLSPKPPFDPVHEPEWLATQQLVTRIRKHLEATK